MENSRKLRKTIKILLWCTAILSWFSVVITQLAYGEVNVTYFIRTFWEISTGLLKIALFFGVPAAIFLLGISIVGRILEFFPDPPPRVPKHAVDVGELARHALSISSGDPERAAAHLASVLVWTDDRMTAEQAVEFARELIHREMKKGGTNP